MCVCVGLRALMVVRCASMSVRELMCVCVCRSCAL